MAGMNPDTAPGYAAANVLLDALIAPEPGQPIQADPINLALQGLSEIEGAYTVTSNDEGDVTVTIDHIVGGTLLAMGRLVDLVAEATHASREVVVSDLRAWLSDLQNG
ncbi:hypothetical protein SAMN04487846_2264 [Microbacterium sp. cf046]|nr:hypothetical protein SAMN04487846_2264 [Microbacterium sp. cf046]